MSTKPSIAECPAYEICRAKQVGCEVCLELSAAEWRKHVMRVSYLKKMDWKAKFFVSSLMQRVTDNPNVAYRC